MKPIDYIRGLNNRGIWCFNFEEAQKILGNSTSSSIRKLRKENRIFDPARGFYVIIPEEMSLADRLPPERFIHELMVFYNVPYYAGLLTAASFYGSAHQSPQAFQIITSPPRRNIHIGQKKIVFYHKKNLELIPTQKRKTPTGYFHLSSAEATFLDMIQFNRRIGGISHVATVAYELVEQLSVAGLKEAIVTYQPPIIQRAGYLLELIGYDKGADILGKYIRKHNPIYSLLNPSGVKVREPKHERWKLIVNDTLDYLE